MKQERCDVIILGAGIAGALLATILARHGVSVVVLERGSHPRFAIGESTVPETTFLLDAMSKRFDVPELGHLSNHRRVRTHVTSSCGVKRNFSFAYHRDGEPHRARESTQFPTWGPPFGPDVHFYRQDIDAYLTQVAIAYGARVHQRVDVTEVSLATNDVTARTADGRVFHARYLVDGAGPGSPVVRQLALKRDASTMHTRSRAIFTHMIGVDAYDLVGPPAREHGLPSPFGQGTMHHLFHGGWFWVIPFGNHPTSTNPLTSVGLSLDLDVHGRSTRPPEEEFGAFVRRFPSVERHLGKGRAVRAWVGGDLQHATTRAAGDGFFLLPGTAGVIDALFSGGLTMTMGTLNMLAARLLEAHRAMSFEPQRFAEAAGVLQRGLAHSDKLVRCGYLAMRDFGLWNAFHRVWMLTSTYGATGHVEIVARFDRDGDRGHFDAFDRKPNRGSQSGDLPELSALVDACATDVFAFEAGALTAGEATARIYGHLGASGLCPAPWRLTDPAQRCPTTFTLLPLARLAAWGYFHAPPSLRKNFDLRGRVLGVARALGRDAGDELRRGAGLVAGVVKDALRTAGS